MVYGVSHDTDPISFQEAFSGPESKEWIQAIFNLKFGLWRNPNLGTLLFASWKKGNSSQVGFHTENSAKWKFCRNKTIQRFMQREGMDLHSQSFNQSHIWLWLLQNTV